jgi:hypothetical protein
LKKSSAFREGHLTIDQVSAILDAVLAVDADELELLVQEAHECDIHQTTEPAEPFPVTRQALRMFWHFRCNLESVEVLAARD